jgi:predicted transcriptional regulator
MATILISIKKEYVDKILTGEKKVEYRTLIPKNKVDRIVIC